MLPVMQNRRPVPDPVVEPMLGFPFVCDLLTISVNKGYELISAGEFPVPLLRVGGRWKVRTVDLRRYLGLDQPVPAA
jgi:hypothetical protein